MPTLHVPLLHVVFAFCGATIACHAHRVRQRKRERECEEKRAHRAWPLYSSIFVCRISWHFSVRRQLLPVSVSVTLAPPFPPVRTLLCRRALFVLARVQDVPTFCCPWVSFAAGPCNTPAHRLPVLFSFCLPTFQLPILAIDMCANSRLQLSFSCCAAQVSCVCVKQCVSERVYDGFIWVTHDCTFVLGYPHTNVCKFCLLLHLYQPASSPSPSAPIYTACSFPPFATPPLATCATRYF